MTMDEDERLRRARASMASGLDRMGRVQGLFDRLQWVVWGVLVLILGGFAGTFLLRSGTGN